jgi:hypothetical protein
MAADEHRLTRIENKVLIGVHRCSSAAQIDLFILRHSRNEWWRFSEAGEGASGGQAD